jgi:hypothetical protein
MAYIQVIPTEELNFFYIDIIFQVLGSFNAIQDLLIVIVQDVEFVMIWIEMFLLTSMPFDPCVHNHV